MTAHHCCRQVKTPLRFEAVHFAYPSRPTHAGANGAFTLDIQPGESVALVGPSGAGKSTVFELMLRFYDPLAGAIRVWRYRLASDSHSTPGVRRSLWCPSSPRCSPATFFTTSPMVPSDPAKQAVEALQRNGACPRLYRGPSRRLPQSILGAQGVQALGRPAPTDRAGQRHSRSIRSCCCSTKPPVRSTPRANGTCSRRSQKSCKGRTTVVLRTDSQQSSMPTASSCMNEGASCRQRPARRPHRALRPVSASGESTISVRNRSHCHDQGALIKRRLSTNSARSHSRCQSNQ